MPDLRALTLKHLRAHEATVRHGSLTAAARELLVTPPAITAQLKVLEDLVGSPLYDRTQDRFVVNAVGAVVLRAAEDIGRLVATAEEQIRALQSGAAGSIVFGAVSTAKYIVPSIVARFHSSHPQIKVHLVVGNRGDILRGLELNQFDVLIMGRPPDHLALSIDVLADHPHILIAPPSHRLASVGEIAPEHLAIERFLSREPGSGTRLLLERLLTRIQPDGKLDVVDMGTNETIKQAVIAGLGIALISQHTCLAELKAGKLVILPVNGLPIVRQWHLIRRADRETSKAAELFSDFVRLHFREHVGS